MYLGNSRLLQGITTNEVVYGEWKAIAPDLATNGTYGTTGDVRSVEWISSYNTLMVGGSFKNFVSGSQQILVNSIAKFNSDWFGLTSSGAGATTGVLENSLPGDVWSIRDIVHSGTSYIVLIGGNFDQAGYLSNSDLNIAQYSMESGWTGNSSTFSANDTVYHISNVANSSSSGATAYISGFFGDVGGSQNIFSPNIAAYFRNFSTNTGTFPSTGGNGVVNVIGTDFQNIYSSYGDSLRFFVLGQASDGSVKIRTYNILNYNFVGEDNLNNLNVGINNSHSQPNFVNYITSSPTTATSYVSTTPIVKKIYFPSNSITTISTGSTIDDNITCANKVFYNSGTHLVVGGYSNSTDSKIFVFYNIDSGKIKPVTFPDNSIGTRINSIAVDDNTGTVYVGGNFVFRDSDGNTAQNVAKFVPHASKLP